ncbi:hypothetical protein Glove_709g36 [Diversispora epigaea]|uniref:Uncharacterized protein n=1 Tax=Diversispora epigaea TaxID=1348612 RepID=A0A397G5D6_9GLOM|nr:hypothetical protein Glove_709g36 [Diversispora epigaea]
MSPAHLALAVTTGKKILVVQNRKYFGTREGNTSQRQVSRATKIPCSKLALAASQHKDPINLFKKIVKLGSRTDMQLASLYYKISISLFILALISHCINTVFSRA